MRWRDLQPGDIYVDGAFNTGYLVLSSTKECVGLLMLWGPSRRRRLTEILKIDDMIPTMYHSQVWRDGKTINGY